MKRISRIFQGRKQSLALTLVALGLIAVVGCSDHSPAIGKFYTGRTLHLSVVAMERQSEIVYSLPVAQNDSDYYRISPEEPGNELLLLRLKVQNHKATSAIVDIDQSAAELRDFFHEKYFPIDVKTRPVKLEGQEVVPRGTPVARCPIDRPSDMCFLWNPTYTDGSTRALELIQGHGVEGWLIFEVPVDTEIRELRWRAGDGLTITF